MIKDELLYTLQKDFPLAIKPFEEIAKKLGISEEEVIRLVKEQKESGIIRQTSAIFDTKKLGYSSSLVAFKVKEDEIDRVVEILNSHPGISHNYERDHEFNIWFTIAVPPTSSLGLEKSVELLADITNVDEFIILPTLKLFKIAVKLDTTGKAKKKESVKKREFKEIKLNDFHKQIIRYAQEDIDIVSEPFLEIIKKIGCSYEEFFNGLEELKSAGVLRRFATILNHRRAGFNANAMVVWDIDEDKAVEAGEKLAAFSAVSHCYLRPKYPNWQYNLFTMIHGKTKEDTNSVIEDIANDIEYKSYMPLYSSREFKKVRLKYFTNDEEIWEETQLN